jgi:signal transduction histidine kinase
MKLRSITTRMVLATTLLVTVATLTFSQIFLLQLRQALIADFVRQGQSLTENLSLNAELGLLLEDRDAIEQLGKNLLTEDMVTRVTIRANQGNIAVDMRKKDAEGQSQVFTANVMLSRPKEELSVFLADPQRRETQFLGVVEVAFSQKRLWEIIETMKRRIYTFSLFGLLAGGSIAFYLSWVILKPVKRLVHASKAIADGNWEMQVEESGDDEIGQLTRDFNVMAGSLVNKRRELEESYRQLARQERMAEIGRFSTVVAHEMKNPLGIIRGAINIMAKNDTADDTRHTMVKYINEEVTRLNQLAEEFLIFARPAVPNMGPINLIEAIDKLIALTEARLDDGKGVGIRLEKPEMANLTICGDKNQIFQALLNLVENGVQSSPEGGVVTIGVESQEEGVRIVIADNGPGIREDDRERIFEPFFTRKEKGTGLGLAIVKRIVDMHGGTINICPSKSGGACFIIWLPKEQALYERT